MNATTEAKPIMNESYVEISFDEANKVIIAKWKGFLNLAQVKNGCEAMNKYITDKNVQLHLSDHSQLKVLSKEVQNYLVGTWFSQVEALGLRKIAVKLAEDVFAQATVNNVNTTQKTGNLTIDSFGDNQTAYAWLEK